MPLTARAANRTGPAMLRSGPMAMLHHHLRTPEELQEEFRKYLRSHGVKYTSARQKVLDAVLDLHEHFEAEQVLYQLKERGWNVGKATVYRTLPLLVECGILKQVRFDVKQAHYEHDFGEGPHDHMVCRRCGRIIEFASDEIVELRSRIAQRHHFHVVSHRFQLSGLCWECSITCPVAMVPLTSQTVEVKKTEHKPKSAAKRRR